MKKGSKKQAKLSKSISILNLDAAGIDIGSKEHYVAVPEGRSEHTIRSFKTFTADLYVLANWLKECGIKTVAMESTGVYWLPLFNILEERGFEVLLVNAYHVKNVPGRKTDVSDCQWLQQLHTYGLLRGSFQPDAKIRELRTYQRQIVECDNCIQNLLKSFESEEKNENVDKDNIEEKDINEKRKKLSTLRCMLK